MNEKTVQHLSQQLTEGLTDAGKIIEGGWLGFRLAVIPTDASETQVSEMRKAFFAEIGVQNPQALRLLFGQRPAIGATGEIDEGVDLFRLAVDKKLSVGGGPILDWLPQRLENFWVSVLRCKLQELREGVDRRECVAADEMEFVPESIEMLPLSIVEHQPHEMIVFVVEQRD